MRARNAIVAVLIVSAVGVAGWWWSHVSREETPSPSVPTTPVEPAMVADRVDARTPPSSLPLPLPALPADFRLPSQRAAEHEAAAQAGDPEAMLRLGIALHSCIDALVDADGSKMHAEHERELESLRDRPNGMDPDSVPYQNVTNRISIARATRADCLAIGAERIRTGLQWTELAARAGDLDAKVQYANDAFREFPTADALLANLDDLARRRDLARAWAMEALDAGKEQAVGVIAAGYYGDSPLFPRDTRRGAPYAMAREMLGTRRQSAERFRALYENGPPREQYGWGTTNAWVNDEAAWQEALARAREIVDRIPPDPPR